MDRNFNIKPSLPFKWVEMKTNKEAEGIRKYFTKDYIPKLQ